MTAVHDHTGRIAASTGAPDLRRMLLELNQATESTAVAAGVDRRLLELIKIRASQINGCAYCIDMHTRDARAAGEDERRIYALNAWRETPFFDERERAALALTESITLLTEGHVPDEVYQEAARVFTEAELTRLIWAAAVINTWNRLAVTSRSSPR